MTQRDAFFGEVIKAAMEDTNIMILSADSGAPAFDAFRKDRPKQWIHCGISEASMVTAAAGLALSGKKVFCFAIIPFITGRVFDQIKVAIALRGLPVTLVGVGAGFSYDDGGPTHYGVEDIGIMKNLKGIEIFSPYDADSASSVATMCLNDPKFRYVRLDRHVLPEWSLGPKEEKYPGLGIVAYGAMIPQALKLRFGNVFPVTRVFPWEAQYRPRNLVVLEEHFYTGGLGESISSWVHDHGDTCHMLRIAIPDHYEWENGGRAHLWKRAGLDVESLVKKISQWLA